MTKTPIPLTQKHKTKLQSLKTNRAIRAHLDGFILHLAKTEGAINTTTLTSHWNANRPRNLPPLDPLTAPRRVADLCRMGILYRSYAPAVFSLKNTIPSRLQIGLAVVPDLSRIFLSSPNYHFTSGQLQRLIHPDIKYDFFMRRMNLLSRLGVIQRVAPRVWTLHPTHHLPIQSLPVNLAQADPTHPDHRRSQPGASRNTPPYLKALRKEYGVDEPLSGDPSPNGHQAPNLPALPLPSTESFDPFK